MNIQSTNLG